MKYTYRTYFSVAMFGVVLLTSGCVIPTVSLHSTQPVIVSITELESGKSLSRVPFRVVYSYEMLSPFFLHYQFRAPPELQTETDAEGKAVVKLAAYSGWIELDVNDEESSVNGAYYGRFTLNKELIRDGGIVDCRWDVSRGRRHLDLRLTLEPLKPRPNRALQ